jgi:uncharacterized membrane protein
MDIKHTIELVDVGFEGVGVMALVIGTLLAFTIYASSLLRPGNTSGNTSTAYQALRRNLGKAILIGLELLVAADIIRSVALDATFASVGVLGLLVLVRTFLSWSLEVEINGTWPWQRARLPTPAPDEP